MKRFRILLFLVTGLTAVSGVGAQAVLSDILFTPSTFFVGDHVELRIDFEISVPIAVEIPESMPDSEWAEIQDIRMERADDSISIIIDFIPFAPGTRTLPAMELGALQLRDIKVPTHSVLGNSHERVRRLRGQLLFPGTRLAVAMILAVAAMAPFLGFGLFRFAWRRIQKFREAWRVGRPARRLRRLLKTLRGRIGSDAAPRWYAELTDALRTYLSSRIGHDCNAATTAEIAVMSEFLDNESPQARLLEVLQDGDMVKFAGQFADDRSLRNTLDTVESSIQKWERIRVPL